MKKKTRKLFSYLVRQQQADRLQRLLPAVHVVPQEQVVRLGRETAVLEQAEQVAVLPVHVSADLDRRLELQQVRLAHQHFSGRDAEGSDLGLGEGDGAAGASGAGVDEALDDGVEGGVLREWEERFGEEGSRLRRLCERSRKKRSLARLAALFFFFLLRRWRFFGWHAQAQQGLLSVLSPGRRRDRVASRSRRWREEPEGAGDGAWETPSTSSPPTESGRRPKIKRSKKQKAKERKAACASSFPPLPRVFLAFRVRRQGVDVVLALKTVEARQNKLRSVSKEAKKWKRETNQRPRSFFPLSLEAASRQAALDVSPFSARSRVMHCISSPSLVAARRLGTDGASWLEKEHSKEPRRAPKRGRFFLCSCQHR